MNHIPEENDYLALFIVCVALILWVVMSNGCTPKPAPVCGINAYECHGNSAMLCTPSGQWAVITDCLNLSCVIDPDGVATCR